MSGYWWHDGELETAEDFQDMLKAMRKSYHVEDREWDGAIVETLLFILEQLAEKDQPK